MLKTSVFIRVSEALVSLGVRGVGSSNLPSPDQSSQLVKIFQEVRNPPMRLKDVSKSGLAEKFEAAA